MEALQDPANGVTDDGTELFELDLGDVVLQSDIGSQNAELDLIIEGGFAFGFGGKGNGLEQGEGIGDTLTKGIEIAIITAVRAEAGDALLDGGKEAGILTGIGAELSGVLVAGLAAASRRP